MRVKKFPCEAAELLLPMTTLTAKQYIELYSLWLWSDLASDFCCLFACNTFYIKVKKIIRKLGCALSQTSFFFFFLFVEKERTQPLTWDRLTEESVISYCFSSSSFSFRSNEQIACQTFTLRSQKERTKINTVSCQTCQTT